MHACRKCGTSKQVKQTLVLLMYSLVYTTEAASTQQDTCSTAVSTLHLSYSHKTVGLSLLTKERFERNAGH
jgi:hypothetical protein